MSPKFSILLLLIGGFFPTVVSGVERNGSPGNVTERRSASDKDTREAKAATNEVEESFLIGTDFRFDVSRLPLPWSYGPISIGAYHVSLAREPGPHRGPPTRIWGLGFGTSLWMNPVTGWHES